jgi:YHS domain-containing protein
MGAFVHYIFVGAIISSLGTDRAQKESMKKLVLVLAASALMVPAFAQKKPTDIECPVMPDHKVNIKKATKSKMFADYKGRRYFFCCAGCVPAFNKEPDKYKDMKSIPTPKKKK